jgi:putative DNA methylase
MVERRKLIEVSLPLEAINRESAREKSIRHGHPSTMHLWWSRKPLATARAVLFAQLVDDPSGHPEEFPTEEAQRVERERLHRIIEEMVVWENIHDERIMGAARREIMRSTGGNPPAIVDPFAGGGSIPLEAQRLGLEAYASDLNPVAVLINKALIEIPPTFRDWKPVFPGRADTSSSWKHAQGLADDVRSYGQWMRDEAEKRIGDLYPKATLPDGSEATVIAWIWARTVTCPNPACGVEMPLTSKWWLSKKKGKAVYVVPRVLPDPAHPSGKRIQYDLGHDPKTGPMVDQDGTVGRNGAICVACGTGVDLVYVRDEGKAGRMGSTLIAVVAEGTRTRHYLPPTDLHAAAARIPAPVPIPAGNLPDQALGFRVQAYGMLAYADLFTNRQLTALMTFSDLVAEARERVLKDALAAGLPTGQRLAEGGSRAEAYADAVATYLAMGVSRLADIANRLCRWENTREQIRNLFSRQAISMVWDFAETTPFGSAAGSFLISLGNLAKAIADTGGPKAEAQASDARAFVGSHRALLSTDPPYYDNIGYSDLSDFFYVWLRRSLLPIHPLLFSTLLVPKAEELVANPYRYGGKDAAKGHFESGFREVFAKARDAAPAGYPATVYYAFKQSDDDEDGTSSSGWETLLDGMIRSGWSITATWPMRSELGNRVRNQGSNALASSIVLALRPRPDDAPRTDRRGFLTTLRRELPPALRELQQGLIAPVDLPQAVIGPGMAVFSRYSLVLEPDGSAMTVRAALSRINEILDEVLSEQEGDFDAATRFAIAWYRQHGYSPGLFGDANSLANARNTAVATLERAGILTSRGGKVQLLVPDALPASYDVTADEFTSVWEVTHHAMRLLESGGAGPTQALLREVAARSERPVDSENVKELAFLLFSIAEKNGWIKDALRFNTLATSWGDIRDAAPPRASTAQDAFDFAGEDL